MNATYCKARSFEKNITPKSGFSECKCCHEIPKVDKAEEKQQDFPIGRFLRFLKFLKLKSLLSRISDSRDPKKIKHNKEFLLMWALSVFFFRTGSLNDLQQSFQRVPDPQKKILWQFFELPDDSNLPHRQTITDLLEILNPEEFNTLLMTLFRFALKSKVFYNHQHTLGPKFGLACDGFVVHHYEHPHSCDKNGNNTCPYCLPRTINKGTDKEKTYWLHTFVNVAVILPGGVQLPLYVHPLKAEQLKEHETASDDQHKQECELQAAKELLPKIMKIFPKIHFVLLADSLYANEPLIALCKRLKLEFSIVRQDGSLKNLGKRCDLLEENKIYDSYQKEHVENYKNGSKTITKIRWFNGEHIGDEEIHVIRFLEKKYDSKGNETKCYKTEWVVSQRVTNSNCFSLVELSRRRADHEDLHNTLKNRGFNAKHDYARSNANATLIWKMLMFVAFWIFEFFSCTTAAQESKGKCSWKKFAKELLTDLIRETWETLRDSPWLKNQKIQFRWDFSAH